jgi:hypothetical protein
LNEKENIMSKEQQNNIQGKSTTTNKSLYKDSLNGIAKLRPQPPDVQVKSNNSSNVLNSASTLRINQNENNTSASDSNNSA